MSDSLPVELIESIKNANVITVLTGAGISSESGISTFRDQGGLWSRFRPEELANMEAFLANPERVWDWYNYRRNIVSKALPNAAHYSLAEWEKICTDFTLVTQNVDGLHAQAGSRNVIELHGNININTCIECGKDVLTDVDLPPAQVPRCVCGGKIRPGVVWFGEQLPPGVFESAQAASERCDLFLLVGTSSVVYPAASLPEIALASGAAIVEINTQETAFSRRSTFSLFGRATETLPELFKCYMESRS